jgi:hypothetical protein
MPKIPNLFIVGAARAGTTYLWRYLRSHPAVFMPASELRKEPSFFCLEQNPSMSLEAYLSLFKNATPAQKWIGEASVAYLTDASSARQIHDFNPKSRIIILLRNPVDRAYSLYNWMVQDGYEFSPTFETALDLEKKRGRDVQSNWFKPGWYWGYQYYPSGLYPPQVARFLNHFGDNVLIILYESLKESPHLLQSRLHKFLQIDLPPPLPQIVNESRAVINAKVVFILRKLTNFIIQENRRGRPLAEIVPALESHYADFVKTLSQEIHWGIRERFLGRSVLRRAIFHLIKLEDDFAFRCIRSKSQRDMLLRLGWAKKRPMPMKIKTRRQLQICYEKSIRELNRMIQMDLSGWLSDDETQR